MHVRSGQTYRVFRINAGSLTKVARVPRNPAVVVNHNGLRKQQLQQQQQQPLWPNYKAAVTDDSIFDVARWTRSEWYAQHA